MDIDVLGVGCYREWNACISRWHGMAAWLLILARARIRYSARSSHLDYGFDRNSFVADQKMLPMGVDTDAWSIQT